MPSLSEGSSEIMLTVPLREKKINNSLPRIGIKKVLVSKRHFDDFCIFYLSDMFAIQNLNLGDFQMINALQPIFVRYTESIIILKNRRYFNNNK